MSPLPLERQFQCILYSDGFGAENPDTTSTSGVFPLFMSLPVEIRLCIWEMLIRPRAIGATLNSIDHMYHSLNHEQLEVIKGTSTPRIPGRGDPILMSICRESRSLALQHYKQAFDMGLYFNFEQDLLLRFDWGRHIENHSDLDRVRNVAVHLGDFVPLWDLRQDFAYRFDQCLEALDDPDYFPFKGARQIIILYDDVDVGLRNQCLQTMLPTPASIRSRGSGANVWRAWTQDSTPISVKAGGRSICMINRRDLEEFLATAVGAQG